MQRIIDIHTHILPERIPNWVQRFGYGKFIHLEHHKPCCARMMKGDVFFREIQHNCWDAEERMRECDLQGISQQVLSTIPVLFNYWAQAQHALETSRFFNDHIAEVCRRYPDRFFGLGTLPMQDVDMACLELERCMGELGLRGVQIGTHINMINLSDPSLYPFYATAERLGAAVFVHPWDMMGEERMEKYWLPWLVGMPAESSLAICSVIFGGILAKFPRLRFAFAQGGGAFAATFARIAHGFEVRPDLVAIDNNVHPREYLGKFWLDTLVHDANVLQLISNMVGYDKLCVGSDYPFPLGELKPGKLVASMPWDDATKQKINYENALQWLGIKI